MSIGMAKWPPGHFAISQTLQGMVKFWEIIPSEGLSSQYDGCVKIHCQKKL